MPNSSISSQSSDGSNQIEDASLVLEIKQINPSTDFQIDTNIALRYNDGESRSAVTSLSSITTTAPQGGFLVSQNESLLVSWAALDSVSDANNNSTPPRGMRAYLIPRSDENSGPNQAKTVMNNFNGSDPSSETPTYSCQLSFNESDPLAGCTFQCDNAAEELGYLNDSAMQSAYAGITIKEQLSSNSILFTGLSDTEQVYAVILQYLPEGSRSADDSSCLSGSSKKTYTYAQLTGGKEPKLGDPKCFIATAAYGTPWHADIDALRWWRDHVLLRLPGGTLIVQAYYKWSPPLANFIGTHENLRTATQWGLYPLVQGAKLAQHHPWYLLVISVIGLSMIVIGLRVVTGLKKQLLP